MGRAGTWYVSWNLWQFPVDVFEGPHLGDVEQKDDAVSSLEDVDKLGVEGGLEHLLPVGRGPEFEALQFFPLLALKVDRSDKINYGNWEGHL